MKTIHALILLLAALLLAACSTAPTAIRPAAAATMTPVQLKAVETPAEESIPWPTRGWQVSTPEQQGMDSALLAKVQSAIQDEAIELHGLLVIRNGTIVSETYYRGNTRETRHDLWSVTKSFTSTLVGIAIDQGKLSGVDARALEFFPQSQGADDPRKQAMTVENLLTMSSGLGWVEADPTFASLYRSQDWSQTVMDLPMTSQPGGAFAYCSGCSHVLSAIVAKASGQNSLDFAKANLFGPLGITDYDWETGSGGLPIGGWGLRLAARDMAKLGYLYLRRGEWDGKQIISPGWVEAATSHRLDSDNGRGYGYQWWTYPSHNAYTAIGKFGQFIYVAPDLDLVVVITANITDGYDPIHGLVEKYIIPSIR